MEYTCMRLAEHLPVFLSVCLSVATEGAMHAGSHFRNSLKHAFHFTFATNTVGMVACDHCNHSADVAGVTSVFTRRKLSEHVTWKGYKDAERCCTGCRKLFWWHPTVPVP
jgi:hypothetical protein